ncbi:MAG TPA: carboxylating nicotinate-nucleotide diphosphorylase [Mycobacteriales bacterium]|nr:carboxylating nicotinate-nucleotide diphosphorylase [Mycobacteriales bacterium]
MTLRASTRETLAAAGLDPEDIEQLVHRALTEDLGDGLDVTSVATVPFDLDGAADFVAHADGVIAGLPVVAAVLEIVSDDAVVIQACRVDGDPVASGDVVLSARCLVRALLTAERTALNLLCHLSGVATSTRRWVDAVAGTGAVILDTRKTTPGLRVLEKYAVRCGGGRNKRMGLYDGGLVKDNHVLAAGGVAEAFRAIGATFPGIEVQVECDTLQQVDDAVAAGAGFLLCDNMTVVELAEAVRRVAGRAVIEATGGLTLDRARAVAETGVDFLSVGALTHSAPALDMGMDLRPIREG